MAEQNKYYESFRASASLDDVAKIDKDINGMNRGKIAEVWSYVQALVKLVKDPSAAWTSKAAAIATLLYTISPVDAIPDLIPVVGLTDDAALIMSTVALLAVELKKYLVDLEEQKQSISIQHALALEEVRYQNQLKLEAENQKAKMRHQVVLVSIVSGSLVLMALIFALVR